MARLWVNIDHVATLRQARGEGYPSLVNAANVCLNAGADQITIHLREDRRHIQDTDVGAIKLVTQNHGVPLNLELGCHDEIIAIAIETKPDWICIVPEKREERTTEGGLDVMSEDNFKKIAAAMKTLREGIEGVKISLFVEANTEVLQKCIELKCDAVEIHTGDYARAILEGEDIQAYIDQYQTGKQLIEAAGIGYHAGHGLTDQSLVPLVENKLFAEYNIGHWIICDSVFCGLSESIGKLNKILKA